MTGPKRNRVLLGPRVCSAFPPLARSWGPTPGVGLALSLASSGGASGSASSPREMPFLRPRLWSRRHPSTVPGSASARPPPTPAAQSRCPPGADDSASCHIPQQPHCGERPTPCPLRNPSVARTCALRPVSPREGVDCLSG